MNPGLVVGVMALTLSSCATIPTRSRPTRRCRCSQNIGAGRGPLALFLFTRSCDVSRRRSASLSFVAPTVLDATCRLAVVR